MLIGLFNTRTNIFYAVGCSCVLRYVVKPLHVTRFEQNVFIFDGNSHVDANLETFVGFFFSE